LTASWLWLLASFLPIAAMCVVNAIAGNRLVDLFDRMVQPFESLLPGIWGLLASVAAYMFVPTVTGLLFAFLALRGFKNVKTQVAVAGWALCWLPIAIYACTLLALTLATIVAFR
jgi:hypothetical protein